MANFPGRNDRRRRVLNDEVFSASRSHLALRAEPHEKAEGRYGEAAGVEHHPQISDFVPRQLGSIAFFVVIGAIVVGLIGGLRTWEETLAVDGGPMSQMPQLLAASRGLTSWIGCIVLFTTSLACWLILSIRKHRLDDDRGRYRIWRWAGVACLLASANCVTGMHAVVAEAGEYLAGWSALREGAAWWVVLGVPALWIAFRVWFDARESRAAAGLLLLSAAAYTGAFVSFMGWLPSMGAVRESDITSGSGLMGHWLLFAGVMAYARHVVLDAQGLLEISPAEQGRSASSESRAAEASTVTPSATAARTSSPATIRISDASTTATRPTSSAKSQSRADEWVDGSRRERDRYEADNDEDEDEDESSSGRKFSKAERKQQRKLKARNRAA